MPKNNNASNGYRFEGFDNPTTTPVPDVLFDELMTELSDPELRVTLYIIRRTYGFKKSTDNISLKQMVEGIVTRNGRVLDRGAGVSKASAARAVKTLVEKGIIVSQRNRSSKKGDEPTTYALKFRGTPVSHSETGGGLSMRHGGVSWGDTQQTVEQQTVLQETDISSNSFDKYNTILQQSEDSKFFEEKTQKIKSNRQDGDSISGRSGPSHNGSHPKPEPAPRRSRKDELQPIAHTIAVRAEKLALRRPKTTSRRVASLQTDLDSPQPETAPKKRGRPPKAPEQIEWMVNDFSAELHDEEHTPSNIGQTARLFKDSGLSEADFVSLMYQARSRTKQAGNIEKLATEGGEFGIRNRMPYFFACLRDLLERG